MDLNEYQRRALDTAIFPREVEDFGMAYAALGLVNEIGEWSDAPHDEDTGELGDVCWYWAVLLAEVAKVPSDLDGIEVDPDTLLSEWGAKIAGVVKKHYRDTRSLEETAGKLLPMLAGVLKELRNIARFNNGGLDRVLQYNVDKLASRKARGVLKGDGGER